MVRLNLELFSCSGGMAEGFRRAGITFDVAVDQDPDACDSYERNLGHRPIKMDVRDLLRLWRAGGPPVVDLIVADPPCTPWSVAGHRKGRYPPPKTFEIPAPMFDGLVRALHRRGELLHSEGETRPNVIFQGAVVVRADPIPQGGPTDEPDPRAR